MQKYNLKARLQIDSDAGRSFHKGKKMFIILDWAFFRKANWWLGCAVVFSLLYIWGISESLGQSKPYTPLEMIQTIINGIGIISLWGLGLRKAIINATFWKIFFIVDLCIYILTWIVPGSPHPEIPLLYGLFITIFFFGPYYTGIFMYAFRSQKIWKQNKKTNQAVHHIQ